MTNQAICPACGARSASANPAGWFCSRCRAGGSRTMWWTLVHAGEPAAIPGGWSRVQEVLSRSELKARLDRLDTARGAGPCGASVTALLAAFKFTVNDDGTVAPCPLCEAGRLTVTGDAMVACSSTGAEATVSALGALLAFGRSHATIEDPHGLQHLRAAAVRARASRDAWPPT